MGELFLNGFTIIVFGGLAYIMLKAAWDFRKLARLDKRLAVSEKLLKECQELLDELKN